MLLMFCFDEGAHVCPRAVRSVFLGCTSNVALVFMFTFMLQYL